MIRRLALALVLCLPGGALAAPPPPFEDDPTGWWSAPQTITEARLDPLARRAPNDDQRPVTVENGAEPLLYRLWGLPPLQSQVVRQDEVIVEAWVRPTAETRQAVIRLTLRSDGRAFLQARTGLGCCKPQIDRRVDIDVELSSVPRDAIQAMAADSLWNAPRFVRVQETGVAQVSGLCTGGTSYDLTLVADRRARAVRRACDQTEIGQAATVLSGLIGLALNRDPRFDAAFPRGADFTAHRTAYEALIADGGRLAAP